MRLRFLTLIWRNLNRRLIFEILRKFSTIDWELKKFQLEFISRLNSKLNEKFVDWHSTVNWESQSIVSFLRTGLIPRSVKLLTICIINPCDWIIDKCLKNCYFNRYFSPTNCLIYHIFMPVPIIKIFDWFYENTLF